MRRALRGATLCVIARPNNPTGSLYDRDAINELVADFPDTIFIIDEAYAPYAPTCSMFDPQAPSNQVHLGSLSKNGLAALRIGYCAADPALTYELDKIRMPYNVPQPSITLAEAMLSRHQGVLEGVAIDAIARREAMRAVLARLPLSVVHPSHANMVLVSFPTREHALQMRRALLEHDVQVRHVSDEPGFRELGFHGCLRVSVGSETEIAVLTSAVDAIAQAALATPTLVAASAGAAR
jgi:histidinol-phosphate/aromatic aminotransferase/cobyric acid decarboxylase-like protein